MMQSHFAIYSTVHVYSIHMVMVQGKAVYNTCRDNEAVQKNKQATSRHERELLRGQSSLLTSCLLFVLRKTVYYNCRVSTDIICSGIF